ncbi:4'-phosphopantetheinyl transferase superfamily protein [Bacillus aquiflavi]|uniref:4'-phosphopantetheinyl transferase superfamily protein n=1 Tax=Bacillus aquiflavi TaxID=2672567 RepID=A0A6B3W467_9BACI|nr:4'-phosphopantetheinyl transferase superfamily protein [Bacillus aquiflavi]MBA4537131.1 4'-phosphopantetheinyl transferase superfamily protein [Bacillus aquiflavi]NEY82716.1 4'-phosphopantetheinyl transferase superfamily protein [Bacillus aquiflavi]UAC49759.1 4'-phosphopantetheinyl transferase superfamily protein [Bacillus aquiflavi]
MLQIHAIKVPFHIADLDYKKLVSFISSDKREKLSRFYYKRDTYRSLLGDILVRLFLWEHFLIPNNQIKYSFNQFGKPQLKLPFPFSFNISHSEDWVICVFDHKNVGIDIEKINNVNLQIAKRYFSQIEYEDLISLNEPMRTKYFFDLWTLKESFLKCIGTGLYRPLNSFTIRINKSTISCTEDSHVLSSDLSFQLYNFDCHYSLAACAYSKLPDKIKMIHFDELMSRMRSFTF